MFALFAAFLAVFLLPTPTLAQDDSKYTVWGSVIFSRTGERTPAILGDIPTQLTALGAQQQFGAGSFFRDRYLESFGSTNGLDSAPIVGLNANTPDVRQIYVAALDMQSTVASAQAFMQGFYPPFQLTNNDTEVQHLLDPINIAANNTYVSRTTYAHFSDLSADTSRRSKRLLMATSTPKFTSPAGTIRSSSTWEPI